MSRPSGFRLTHIDFKHVISDYIQYIDGKEVLYVPLPNDQSEDKNLIVLLGPLAQRRKFFALSQFLKDQRADLLFINDLEDTWYLEHDKGAAFSRILQHFFSHYPPENVTIFGTSMSGYGALYHGIKLDVNVLASNPQISLTLSKQYGWDALRLRLEKLSDPIDLDNEWLETYWKNSALYITHGSSELDRQNIGSIDLGRAANKKLIIHSILDNQHRLFLGAGLTQYIYTVHDLLKTLRADINIGPVKRKPNHKPLAQRTATFSLVTPQANKIFWHQRGLHEVPGKTVFFNNCGLYRNDGTLSGAHYQFIDNKWQLIDPIPTQKDQLLLNHDFSQWSLGNGPFDQDTQFTADHWWIRVMPGTTLSVSRDGEKGVCIIHKPNSRKFSFLNQSIKVAGGYRKLLVDRIITFTADIWVSSGKVRLLVTMRTPRGFPKYSVESTKSGCWERLTLCEVFEGDMDVLFARIVFPIDNNQEQQVRIKNFMAVSGNFPTGIPIPPSEESTSQ